MEIGADARLSRPTPNDRTFGTKSPNPPESTELVAVVVVVSATISPGFKPLAGRFDPSTFLTTENS